MVTNYLTAFRQHPFIQSIASIKKWTISNENKIPIDMYDFMYLDKIKGANFYDEHSLVDLDTLDNFFKKFNQTPSNHAFYLETALDGFLVLDIEPNCPEEIRTKLLQTNFIYGEVSLSGKGYHLIYKIPDSYHEYPAAHNKPALKHPSKYYEVLMNHFCTFTGKLIEPPKQVLYDFNDVYKELAAEAKEINKQKEASIQSLSNKPNTEKADFVLELLHNAAQKYPRKPKDFTKDSDGSPDMSRYEWSYICYLYKKLDEILAVSAIQKEHEYTDEEQAYFLYTVITTVLPHRPKHDTFRNTSDCVRLPWLGYLVKDVMEKTDPSEDR